MRDRSKNKTAVPKRARRRLAPTSTRPNAIAQQRRSGEVLRKSEARFRSYFELGLIGMAMTSPTKGILEVNDELCRILGYKRNELLKRSWAEMTYPKDLATDVAQFNRVMAGEIDGYTIDKRWIRKDGQIIDSIMAARCVRRADRSVDYFVGLVLDTTERKRAEETVRQAHERVDLILASISEQFFALSKDWRFTYFNQHAGAQIRRLGKAPERLIGKVLWEEFPDVPNEANLRRVMSERVAITDELYYAPLGEWLENHMYPSEDGGLVTFQRYITARKRTEEELLKTQAELAHVLRVRTMGEMAASIAHEINQPLGAIVNNGNVCLQLTDAPGSKEKWREALQDIVQDANRASAIIARIRALTKGSTSERILLSVKEMIDDVLALANHDATNAAVKITTSVPDSLRVTGDRIQLQQMLLNLVMNAIEAMRDVKEEKRMMTIQANGGELENKPAVVVSVQDNGDGFSSGDALRLFEPFFTTKPNGTGMGLGISRTIAEAHGGRLWAIQNTGPGATFCCALPLELETAL
jgi:PAS domain S-box-containing protein